MSRWPRGRIVDGELKLLCLNPRFANFFALFRCFWPFYIYKATRLSLRRRRRRRPSQLLHRLECSECGQIFRKASSGGPGLHRLVSGGIEHKSPSSSSSASSTTCFASLSFLFLFENCADSRVGTQHFHVAENLYCSNGRTGGMATFRNLRKVKCT